MHGYRRKGGIVLIFAISFTFTLGLGRLAQLPLGAGDFPRLQTIPKLDNPGNDAFFVVAVGDDLSHVTLYHDIGNSIANARQADILIFGNSRAQIGWREDVIYVEAEKLGLRVFNLAVGHGDTGRFALELIRQHDLRPRVVIGSGGPFMFNNRVSGWAREVMSMTAWEARKQFWERTAAWNFRALLHRYLPKLDYVDQPLLSWWVHYRSEKTGWWRAVLEPDYRYPIGFRKEKNNYERALPLARQFKQELDQRDALLVLTMLPYADTQWGHLPYLASELGISVIIPDFTGLQTADGSHLHRDSAIKVSQDFWDQFIALQPVRDKLGLLGSH